MVDDIKSLRDRLQRYEELEEYDKAIECGDKLLEENPQDENALFIMSRIYNSIGDDDRELFYMHELANLNPEMSSFEIIKLFTLSRFEEAIQVFEEHKDSNVFDHEMKSHFFTNLLGHCYNQLKMHEEAVKYMSISDSIKPTVDKKIVMAKNYIELNDFPNACKTLLEALHIDKEDNICLFLMVAVCYYMEEYILAIDYSNRLLSLHECDDVYNILAAVYFEMGEIEKGYDYLIIGTKADKIDTRDFGSTTYILRIASRLSKAGFRERAERIYELIEKKIPNFPGTYIERAKHYKRIGKTDLAKKDFKKYNEIFMGNRMHKFEEL